MIDIHPVPSESGHDTVSMGRARIGPRFATVALPKTASRPTDFIRLGPVSRQGDLPASAYSASICPVEKKEPRGQARARGLTLV